MNRQTEAVIREIEKVIIGKRSVVERVLMAVLSEGHILLDDVPGVGKTTLAVACSRVMGMDYHRIQFTPDVVPSDIIGFSIYNKATGAIEYKPGVVMTNLLLADEITAMLDLITQSQIWNFLLEEVRSREIGLLVVSHSEPLLQRICTGRIQL